ncbi:hypothetical protein [Candidatus Nanohalobium constans]|uniref:Uncharacterized protein n=1 Tax=Candidatus Nanohalobium constans TaxID=2565781 RepID=A0A5Q0UFS9_9ARCH|nr:hypothetical protein [Candidatus Nanohalobium constans]QGA80483.1 hypothetical protein LC1Nh_0587 [Candidatus Nanohalobium constans]
MTEESEAFSAEKIYQEVKEHGAAGAGVISGLGIQTLEVYPELVEDTVPLVQEVPEKFFQTYLDGWNGDKFFHFAFSYGCAHFIIEGMNQVDLEDNYVTKAGVVYGATFVGRWMMKEKRIDPEADPVDMYANLAGASAAILEDQWRSDFSPVEYRGKTSQLLGLIENIYSRHQEDKESLESYEFGKEERQAIELIYSDNPENKFDD